MQHIGGMCRRTVIYLPAMLALLRANGVGTLAAQPELLVAAAETLARVKSSAEDRVRLLRGRFSDGAIDEKNLLEAQRRYADARAEVNAGLERILIEMTGPDRRASDAAYAEVARRAGEGADRFISFADGLLFGDIRGGVADAGLNVVGSLITALVDIWKQLRGERNARNDEVARRLEALKWATFSDIR
jgi:hypothetical protein